MNVARIEHTANLLQNGKVLITGGIHNSSDLNVAELYDPLTRLWTVTSTMKNKRYGHVAITLRNGKVLVAGGYDYPEYLNTAEVYDPSTGI